MSVMLPVAPPPLVFPDLGFGGKLLSIEATRQFATGIALINVVPSEYKLTAGIGSKLALLGWQHSKGGSSVVQAALLHEASHHLAFVSLHDGSGHVLGRV